MNPLSNTTDFYQVFSDVTGADLDAWNTAAEYGESILDEINDYWEKAEYPVHLVRRIAEYGIFTDGLDIDGHDKLSPLAAGLVSMEIARADGSMASALAVQAGLVLRTIAEFGSAEQKAEWLGPLAAVEKLGSFALTEPDHGSDSIALETRATKTDDGWVINGQKRWIGHGSIGDIAIVFARMDDGEVGGFLVPQSSPGYSGETITGKVSLRAIPQALITLTDVKVPHDARLPGIHTFRDVVTVLTATRVSTAWMALGHAIACFEDALNHARTRHQFGRPLVKNQVIQQRLSNMIATITSMSLYCRRLAELDAAGELTQQQASLAKVHNTRGARAIAADARDMLGGSGILLENHVIRHFADMEALHTYEGTDTMQSLIVGKNLTGVGAFT